MSPKLISKIERKGLFFEASFVKKEWSEDMCTHEIVGCIKKRFFFKRKAYLWTQEVILKDIINNNYVEVITDG